MFTAAPVRTIPPSGYLERRRRLQRLHDQTEERMIPSTPSPRIAKSVERFVASLARALPGNDLVIEDMVIRGDQLELRYRIEEASEAAAKASAVAVTKVEILRLENCSVMESWDMVYQVKTQPEI